MRWKQHSPAMELKSSFQRNRVVSRHCSKLDEHHRSLNRSRSGPDHVTLLSRLTEFGWLIRDCAKEVGKCGSSATIRAPIVSLRRVTAIRYGPHGHRIRKSSFTPPIVAAVSG